METPYYKSKQISLIILAATAVICNGTLLRLFNDPEGPNLVVTGGLALILFCLSAALYLWGPTGIKGIRRLLTVIAMQVSLVIILYFWLK